MARKKKEKILTLEEIKDGLRKTTESRWVRGEQHFGLLSTPNGLQFMPLSDHAEKQTLIVFMIDPADYTLELVLNLIDAWKAQYRKLKWLPILAVQQKYPFAKFTFFLERFKTHACISTLPLYFDPFGELFEKFGSTKEPVVALFHRGELRFSDSLLQDFVKKTLELENQLHLALRSDDPGIPLPLILPQEPAGIEDIAGVTANEMERAGQWTDNQGSLSTDDQHASISTHIEGNAVRLVCTPHALARKSCRIIVTLNGDPIPKPLRGEHVRQDEKGNSIFDADKFNGIYEIIRSPDPVKGEIKFSFSSVLENPVIFFEMRVGRLRKNSA